MCLNQAQGPKLDEKCLDHGSHTANQLVMIAVLHVYSQALGQPHASDHPSTTPTSRRQIRWERISHMAYLCSLAFRLQTWIYLWIRSEIWQQLSRNDDMTDTRVIGSNLMVQPIQLSCVHYPYRVTKAQAYRTKRRLEWKASFVVNQRCCWCVVKKIRPQDINHMHSGSIRFTDLIPWAQVPSGFGAINPIDPSCPWYN